MLVDNKTIDYIPAKSLKEYLEKELYDLNYGIKYFLRPELSKINLLKRTGEEVLNYNDTVKSLEYQIDEGKAKIRVLYDLANYFEISIDPQKTCVDKQKQIIATM